MYESIQTYTREWIDVIPIDYAGHGKRILEDFYTDFQEMVSDVATKIISQLNGKPFAILGYSMGSLVAYEVYYEISRRTKKLPVHMFFAAHMPPELHVQTEDHSYTSAFRRLEANLSTVEGGVLVLQDQELLDIVMPRYCKDLMLYSSYEYRTHDERISSNITILFSDEDNKNEQIYGWSKYSSKFCLYEKLKGNHFFINIETEKMSEILNRMLFIELSL